MELCERRAKKTQEEAIAAENNELVPPEEYITKLKIAADAEIALMTCKWYHSLKIRSEKEVEKLKLWREKCQKRIDCPRTVSKHKFGPKVGKKEAQRARKATLKMIEAYSALIAKESAASAMALQEIDSLAKNASPM